jgi:cyclopropane-fatty-acyl-phospholipid synthase
MSTSAQPRKSIILADLFRDYQGPPLSVRLWNGWEWRSIPQHPPSVTLSIRTPNALASLVPSRDRTRLREAFIQGEIDVDGDMRTVFTLVEFLLDRPYGFLRRLMDLIANSRLECLLRGGYPKTMEDDFSVILHRYNWHADLFRSWLGDPHLHPLAWVRSGSDWAVSFPEQGPSRMYDVLPTRSLEHFLGAIWYGYSLNSHVADRDLPHRSGIVLSGAQAKMVRGPDFETEAPDMPEWQIEPSGHRVCHEQTDTFDRVGSLVMLAPVRRLGLSQYLHSVRCLLKPSGLFLCYSIVASSLTVTSETHGALLSLSGVIDAAESAGFEVREAENLCLDEAYPVFEWLEGLRNRDHTFAGRLSDLSYRTWLMCLAGFAAPLRKGDVSIHQILLSRREQV